MQDPEVYLAALGVTLPCPVDPPRDAQLDAALRVWIGHDVFFFSTPAARTAFEADPARYSEALTDPVSGSRFRPRLGSLGVAHEGRRYLFRDAESHASFVADPRKYAAPVARML